MAFEHDDRSWPIVKARWAGTVSDRELDAALARMDEYLSRGRRFGLLIDSRGGGGFSPEQRTRVIAHMKRQAHITSRLLVQAVGARVRHHYDRPWRPDEPRRTTLVAIAEHDAIDHGVLRAVLEEAGFEVLEAISRNPVTAGTPVIVLTARGDDADAKRGLALGARRYMSKPFDVRDLIAEVLRQVGSRASEGRSGRAAL